MSDQLPTPVTAPIETPGQASEDQQETGQPQYLTREEFLKQSAEIEEKAFRRAQSYVDAGNSKLRQQLAQLEQAKASLEAAGAKIDPNAYDQARNKLLLEAQLPAAQPQMTTAEQEGNAPDQSANLYASAAFDATVKEFGLTGKLRKDDPEQYMIVYNQGPEVYFRTMRQALTTAKQRLERTATEPEARLPLADGKATGKTDKAARLMEIQERDPFGRNATLREERAKLLEELEAADNRRR